MLRNTKENLLYKTKYIEGTQRISLGHLLSEISNMLSERIESIYPEKVQFRYKSLEDIELYENVNEISMPITNIKPHIIFHNKCILGVDGSSIPLRIHPFRVLIARSGIYLYSLKNHLKSILIPYRVSFSILDSFTGNDLEDALKRAESRLLADLETKSIIDFISEIPEGEINLIIMDGPMYHPVSFDIHLDFLQEIYYHGIPIIYIVKNSISRRLTRLLDLPFLDSDLLSLMLKPHNRTPSILIKNVRDTNGENLLPNKKFYVVSFYYMSPSKILFRIDAPLWVIEEYLLENVVKWAISDILLGNGLKSYVISKAENIAKFTQSEKDYIRFSLERFLVKNGVISTSMFNQMRWGIY